MRRRPPDPDHIVNALIGAYAKAFDVALQAMRPHIVTIIKRAISEAREADDAWRPIGDAVVNLFSNSKKGDR
jgi:hypothetical protein